MREGKAWEKDDSACLPLSAIKEKEDTNPPRLIEQEAFSSFFVDVSRGEWKTFLTLFSPSLCVLLSMTWREKGGFGFASAGNIFWASSLPNKVGEKEKG